MKNLIAVTTLTLSALLGFAANASLAATATAEAVVETHQTTGIVKDVDKENGRIMLAHNEVPSLSWPGMTMAFTVQDEALLDDLKSGQEVEFGFIEEKRGRFVITQIRAQ